ncbi:MAG TPA: carbamoyltransferase HypF [Solirubrobacterales bacterium]|nr:carbamoyltransferase HypF [Solirubrobacterales bacterium]
MTGTGSATRRRVRLRVTGTVQGVGFRPFVYRLAAELGLDGWVLNDIRGVVVEAEGEPAAVAALPARLEAEAPPLAAVEAVAVTELEPRRGESGFAIRTSDAGGEAAAPVSADTATCEDCLSELFDPADRRHRYPFVNCTNCGPRFTIVAAVPYDRPLTTMSGFAMCDRCRAEYEDPLDRRFHAQPNACPECGPRARFLTADGADAAAGEPDAVAAAATALRRGAVIAVKGIGGYHLACRADDEGAVAALRSRKHRAEKPFALLVADLAAAAELADLGEEETALLESLARPIVLARRRPGAPVAMAVGPRAGELGLMLPYSPLHHLLVRDAGVPLVLTSGNVADEPIAYRDADARERLAPIADAFLVHDRPIQTRTDDSVARVVELPAGRRPLLLRRSRGFVPGVLPLSMGDSPPVLACGAELKNTFCLAKDGRAWVGHHVGDLGNYETLRSFTDGIAHFEALFAVAPEVVAHDLHPDYLSTRYALEREGVRHVGVQHHHAHLAACLAEHGEAGPAVGAIFDGTGLGQDGTVWGGELLFGDLVDCVRVAHLRTVPLPGGAAAIREPWRMACAWLREAGDEEPGLPTSLVDSVGPRAWRNCLRLCADDASRPTSSMGRLFDAVGVLCGAPARAGYEGQAAIELEAMAAAGERGFYDMPFADGVLDPAPALRALRDDLARGIAPALVAARFHETVARATAIACAGLCARLGTGTVVLGGGVFQNRLLLERCAALLDAADLRVLVPEALPPNDGGISFGQAAVAAARMRRHR